MPKKVKSLKSLRDKTLRTAGRDHLPLPTGRYQKVGCRDLMCGMTRKSGVLMRLFYPAEKRDSNEGINPLLWPNWLPHENYRQGYADVGGIKSKFLMSMIQRSNKQSVFIPAVPNAKPVSAREAGKLPVVVFSHGLGGCRTTYASICTELASQGFIVAAVEHRDNSACLSFFARRARYDLKSSNPNFFDRRDGVDGEATDEIDAEDERDFGDEVDDPNYVPPRALEALTIVPHLEMAWIRHRRIPYYETSKAIYSFRNKQVHHRVRECSRALDVIEALAAGYEVNNLLDRSQKPQEFENLIDMDRVMVMGHSFGGATALMSAATELRFKAAVALDPWMYPIKDEPLDLISQPVLCINTETLSKSPNRTKMAELVPDNLTNPDHRQCWTIKKSKHMQQSDVPYIFGWLTMMLSGMYESGGVDAFLVHDMSVRMAIQFAGKHLDLEVDDHVNRYVEEQRKHLRPTLKQKK